MFKFKPQKKQKTQTVDTLVTEAQYLCLNSKTRRKTESTDSRHPRDRAPIFQTKPTEKTKSTDSRQPRDGRVDGGTAMGDCFGSLGVCCSSFCFRPCQRIDRLLHTTRRVEFRRPLAAFKTSSRRKAADSGREFFHFIRSNPDAKASSSRRQSRATR